MHPDDPITLAGEFPVTTHDAWLVAVETALGGRTFDSVLRSVTADGIEIEPLYTREAVGSGADSQGNQVGRSLLRGPLGSGAWDIRQRHRLSSNIEALNLAILSDLECGVTSIELCTTGIGGQDLLDEALKDVYLDLAPIALVAPGDGVEAARDLLALVASRGLNHASLVADLGCDPIGSLVANGHLGGTIAESMAAVGQLAVEVNASHPLVRTVRADGSPFALAGATPATELAAVVASGVEYVRAMTAAGLDPASALGQVLLNITVTTDQFGDIAKLRALRAMWSRVAQVLGVQDHRAVVQATTSDLVVTQRDPWVNMLRSTIGCFSAATGGADIITVNTFDAAVGSPDQLGLRVARNTQLALMEESNLHRVSDPGGGSWYIESLTGQLADAGWAAFQVLERAGGMVSAIEAGDLQERIAHQWHEQHEAVASRRRVIVGVSDYVDIDEKPLSRGAYPPPPALVGPDTVAALPVLRLSSGFEQLRHAADAADQRPSIFLAHLVAPEMHAPRATWARNFFAAGGIGTIDNGGPGDNDALVSAFTASASPLAAICSSDAVYQEHAVAAASALAAAGAERIYLVGDPGEDRARYEAAGVNEFIYAGCDVLACLQRAHEVLAPGWGQQ